jgi:hypothetical protein
MGLITGSVRDQVQTTLQEAGDIFAIVAVRVDRSAESRA